MAIEFQCVHCNRVLKLKDKCAGLTGECPFCKGVVTVPAFTAPVVEKCAETAAEKPINAEELEFTPPTRKQLDYARKLGIDVPKGICRSALSLLIDGAKDNALATEKQKEFLRELGVKFPDNIRLNQASMLIDGAMNIRDEISTALQRRLEEQWKEAGMLIDSATDDQLLQGLSSKGKLFFAFIMDDDEFRYQENLPMKGRLVWNWSLNVEDVKYLLASLTYKWARDLDMNAYSEEFDGDPPTVEFTASELASDHDNVVHLNINLLTED